MPQSDHWAVPFVVETAIAVDPASVLDVGVGMGQYGMLLRQSLDIARGRLRKEDWQTQIDGIELFEPYRNPLWDYYYDQVQIGDAQIVLANLDRKYDLILMNDVIEHFEKSLALKVLESARKQAAWVLVTTPNGDYPQGAMHGNEAEAHRSTWNHGEFRDLDGFVHEIRSTFLALIPGVNQQGVKLRPGDLPTLFEQTAGSLAKCFRQWLPQMLRSRFGKK